MQDAFYEHRSGELAIFCSRGIDFPAHFHESLELFYALHAGVSVTIGGQTMEMDQGDLAMAFCNSVHAYSSRKDLPDPPQALLLIVPPALMGEYRQTLSEMIPENPFLKAQYLHPDIAYAFSSLRNRSDPPNVRAERALVQLILSRTLPLLRLRRSMVKESLLYQIVDILSTSYREPVTLDDLAKKLGVSRYTISRVFSEKLSCGFPEYLNRLRLSEAENLLVNTDRSITEISYCCGFETPRTFNRAFFKKHAITPREFRQRETKWGKSSF